MTEMFTEDDCQGVILVDATNAFNSLNRHTALLNIRHTCPEFSTYLINTYRSSSKLSLSEEGTTQGDNCASGLYSVSTTVLIKELSLTTLLIKELSLIDGCNQIWYADDGAAGGNLKAIKEWWDKLLLLGPQFGHLPNACKTVHGLSLNQIIGKRQTQCLKVPG